MADEPKSPVKTVTKAIEIINYLAQDTGNRGIGVSELSRVLGMGKSTVHRLLDTLSFYGYVEQDGETNQYRLGWELYKIGQVVPQQNQLLNLNPGYILELSRKTRATVNLGILKRGEILIISKIEGAYDSTHISVRPGEYEAIHATGMGKVMISEMDEEEIWGLFWRTGDPDTLYAQHHHQPPAADAGGGPGAGERLCGGCGGVLASACTALPCRFGIIQDKLSPQSASAHRPA